MLTTAENKLMEAIRVPSGYAAVRLGMKLHPTQAKVIDTLFDKPKTKVTFLCGNEVGKSSHVGAAAILYAMETLKCKVIVTSASGIQLEGQIMPALKTHAHLYPNWEFQQRTIKINGEELFRGFSTNSDARAQGWHEQIGQKLLIIADEAAGIDMDIWQGITRCNATYLLIMGSPDSPEGFFYDACTNPNKMKVYQQFRLTKPECTRSKGWWLYDKDIEDLIEIWGKEHPVVLSSVYGEFASNITDGIISLSELNRCLRNPAIPDTSGGRHVALDFSAGGDESVIAFRNGNSVSIIKAWRDKNTMAVASEMVNILEQLKRSHGLNAGEVSGDADGLGIGIIDRMKELGWNINRFHGGSPANNPNDYKNRIAECWLEMAKKIRNCSIILPADQELNLQILSRKQKLNDGKMALEPKSDMAARGVHSPDRADAVAMALMPPASGVLTFCKVPENLLQPRRHSFF